MMRDDEKTHKNLEYIHKVLKNNGEWAQVAQALKFAVIEAHDVADYDAELAALEAKEASELAANGEASETEVNQKLTSLKKQWRYLEYLVGRQVSEDEIWDKEYANIKVIEMEKNNA